MSWSTIIENTVAHQCCSIYLADILLAELCQCSLHFGSLQTELGGLTVHL